jgi:putative redox protein
MTKMSISYSGSLRCEATHDQSGSQLQTDAPIDNNGKGETFSPTDLLATALSTCMITLMGISAEKSGFILGKVNADVEKIMAAEPRRVQQVKVRLEFTETEYSEKERGILERSALNCPVANSLNQELIQAVKFVYM